MYRLRPSTLLLAVLLACSPPDSFPGTDDTEDDTDATDTDAPVDDGCTGSFTLTFASAPAEIGLMTASWTDQGVELETQAYTGGDHFVEKDADGCLVLQPGTVVLQLLETGCAADAVEIRVTDQCNAPCTEALAAAGERRAASTRTGTTDVEEVLTLDPVSAFDGIAIGSLDAKVCGVTITRASIPEELQPPDTGDDF